MKKLFYVIAILFLVSCKKNTSGSISSLGFLGTYLNSNSQIIVSQTSESDVSSATTNFGIYRGYYIIPSKDIKITSIGAEIPEKGTYNIIIVSGALSDFVNKNYLLLDSINITNTSKFQYKNISQNLILSANTRYLIVYLNNNHHSVYEAQYPDYVTLPLTVNDIEIQSDFYYYGTYYDGIFYMVKGNSTMGMVNNIKGLVDFKYELTQ